MSVHDLSQYSPRLLNPQPRQQLASLTDSDVKKVLSLGEEWLRINRPKTADTSQVVLLLSRIVSEHQNPEAQKALDLLLKGFDHSDSTVWTAARRQIIAIYNCLDHNKHDQIGRALIDKLQVTLGISAKNNVFLGDVKIQYPEFTEIVEKDLRNFPGHKEIVLHQNRALLDRDREEEGEGGGAMVAIGLPL